MFVEFPIVMSFFFAFLTFFRWYQTGDVFGIKYNWARYIVLTAMAATLLFSSIGCIAICSGISFEPTQGGYLVRYESMFLKVLMK